MKEDEIRPKHIFDTYLKLAKEDIVEFFSKTDEFEYVDCPACDKNRSNHQFNKSGFNYVLCNNCNTLYVNPRPNINTIQKYYNDSKQTKYWAEHFYKDTEEQRRDKIFKPRAEMIADFIKKNIGQKIPVLADIGAGFGTFCEEMKILNVADEVIAIEPSQDLANICRRKNLVINQNYLENIGNSLENKVTFATSFELVEHLHTPKDFLRNAYNIIEKGGYFLITTLNIDGYDLKILWDKSKSISPPHHLNFFNIDSLCALLERCGFEIIKKSTPGKLDVDIVKNASKSMNLNLDRFTKYLLEKKDDSVHNEFQLFLQKNNMSSHMHIIAKKV